MEMMDHLMAEKLTKIIKTAKSGKSHKKYLFVLRRFVNFDPFAQESFLKMANKKGMEPLWCKPFLLSPKNIEYISTYLIEIERKKKQYKLIFKEKKIHFLMSNFILCQLFSFWLFSRSPICIFFNIPSTFGISVW